MLVNGTDISALSVKGRAALVAFMAQELSAQPGLCGMDRIELSFYRQKGLFGRLTQKERERIKHEADRFGIAHLLQQDLVRMSAGERQMVLLLCVALQETPLLLLDEPASALDFNRTEQLFMLLRYLCKKGRTVLIVLHDPTQALRYADKLCLIHHGCAELLDPAACDRLYLESSLRKIYPRLRIHGDPLFCYADEDGCDA
jgi:iron complex transport system ATP-binding protein